ncbi:flagellar motor protein MotB [Azotobacter vinelandii]
MTEPLEGASSVSAGSARKALLERQRQLERELARARQATRVVKRQAANSAHEPDTSEGETEGWLVTYLDMMTLLLVLLVVMLAFAGRGAGGTKSDRSARCPRGFCRLAAVCSSRRAGLCATRRMWTPRVILFKDYRWISWARISR